MCTVKLILPTALPDGAFYFKGYVQSISESTCVCIFVTNVSPKQTETPPPFISSESKIDLINGVFNRNKGKILKLHGWTNFIALQESTLGYPEIVTLKLRGHTEQHIDDCIIIYYDYEQMKKSESLNDENHEFTTLQKLIQGKSYAIESKSSNKTTENRTWLSASMLCLHIYNYFQLLKWFLHTIKRNRKISIKHGNLLIAILADVFLGYLVIQFLTPDKNIIKETLMKNLEKLVNSMYSLLKWLMGAPAGLKLNNAFNKMLGQYFSYHVQLWWLFIDISGLKLDIILDVYHYISYFGITFQAALISDFICVVTFHSYCFYVYAARLFNLQISGLIALLRLFVGRKYNPLRNAIDSCEYTNQELFVGTVAFTILLLLLPTTAMYYIVFTTFRLLSLMVQYILAKSIYWIQSLPLYVIILKVIQSNKVAGNILVEVVNSGKSPVVLNVKLFSKSIEDLVISFKPPVQIPSQMEWSGLLSKIFMGKPII